MITKQARLLLAIALGFTVAAPLRAQGLSLQRIFTTTDFRASTFVPLWRSDTSFTLIETNPGAAGTDVWEQGINTGKRDRLIQGVRIVPPGGSEPVEIEDVVWSADQKRALL